MGVHRDTVARLTRKAGDHALATHDELVALSPPTTEHQFDEKWSFVAKKEANCDRSDPAADHRGDHRDHVAYDPEHRLVVAVVPGARDVEVTETLMAEARRRSDRSSTRNASSPPRRSPTSATPPARVWLSEASRGTGAT